MKILVVGSWRSQNAAAVADVAHGLGAHLGERNDELVTGGGTGLSLLVVEAYRAAGGTRYTCYLTDDVVREAVGEEIGPDPDVCVATRLDYPGRNARMVRESDIVISLGGGLGTLGEIIHAAKDYGKPVFVLDGTEIAEWIRSIPPLAEEIVFFAEHVDFSALLSTKSI